MYRNKIRNISAIVTIVSMMGLAVQSFARENLVTAHRQSALKTTVTRCLPATAAIDIDINNVNARLMTGGDMWWNIGQGVAAYEVPKGSGKSSQFAASCWIGGYDEQKQLKVAAQTYRQDGNDYWPGALDASAKIDFDQCTAWDQFWKINKTTINAYIALAKSGGNTDIPDFDVINQWPGAGNPNAKGTTGTSLGLDQGIYAKRTYAPFQDLNGNGIYEPGPPYYEYPLITGDQFIWWVFNDAGNIKLQSQTSAIGVEVQTSCFAYSTQDFLNDATFCQYRVWNYGTLTIDSTYIAVWDDCDLGWYMDDFIGCDTTRGLGIQYNGTNDDGAGGGHPPNSYGLNPPQVGLDFFQGPLKTVHLATKDSVIQLKMTNFTYYNNDASIIGNPTNGAQIYNYMTGSIRDGERFSDDFQGPSIQSKGYGSGKVSNFVFFGDPGEPTTWSECTCNNSPGDRRFIFSSGPFQMISGAKNDIIFGCIWAPDLGGCPKANFKQIKNLDDGAQALFDNNFKTVEGPESPRLVCRELDRKLIFYMVNEFGGNNFGENFGRTNGKYKDSLQYHQLASKSKGNLADSLHNSGDSLYKFQGYMVFQLANSQVSPAQIYNSTTGEVDPSVATLVFQCDIHDSVTKIVNYVKKTSISDTTWVPQLKVTGNDSGIRHSFEITEDAFATSADKRLINYKSYYFVAVAYAYNNFAQFNPLNSNNTQDVSFLMSAHSVAGADIKADTCMPNPANGAMGTVLNSDYGTGIKIYRIEGQGNGGNFIQLDSASEMNAILYNRADSAGYMEQQAPVTVKVVDPVLVPAFDWVLQIKDTSNAAVTFGATWMLTAKGKDKGKDIVDTIYSETKLETLNEQVIEKYGISISLLQHYAASHGPNQQVDNNGYIGSDITFEDPSKSWLYGVQDQADSSLANWERSGSNLTSYKTGNPCNFNDNGYDLYSYYGSMFNNFTPTKSTWAPYNLCATWNQRGSSLGGPGVCTMEIAYYNVKNVSISADMANIPDVNLVFTPDKSLWTKCAVIEMQEDTNLAEGGAPRFWLRRHASWDGEVTQDGLNPIYVTKEDSNYTMGLSLFPGYAIDEGTGKRLNIVFGEDSYATNDNGNDMLWNPSTREFSPFDNSILFGGKHMTYILNTAYDSDKAFVNNLIQGATNPLSMRKAYTPFEWAGIPLTSPLVTMNTLRNGYIPTKTTLRFRVMHPFAPYSAVKDAPADTIPNFGSFPYYSFSTKGLVADAISDTTNRSALLSRIFAVPNPYYGYSGYEGSRLDTRVRIINLPAVATINIFALDGSLIRVLTKTDPNTSYIDWDIRNSIGLPVASGMYLMDVKAQGIGEVVLKWFGAQRPLDVTTY